MLDGLEDQGMKPEQKRCEESQEAEYWPFVVLNDVENPLHGRIFICELLLSFKKKWAEKALKYTSGVEKTHCFALPTSYKTPNLSQYIVCVLLSVFFACEKCKYLC